MHATSVNEPPSRASKAAKPAGFWRSLAEMLDAYLADRTKRAVPEVALRRSRIEVARCRRLMHQHAAVEAGIRRASR